MTNVSIIDQPRWPAMDAETTPAFIAEANGKYYAPAKG